MQDEIIRTDQFARLDTLETEALLEEINPILAGSHFNAATATIMAQELSFYPGFRFLDIADYETTPTIRKFVIHKPGHVVLINWTNEPIYSLNDKAPVLIDELTAPDYVRFFFTYVRGKHGRFIIAETVDDIHWKEEPPPAARKAIGKMLEPVQITTREPDGTLRLVARMMFRDSLFKSEVVVKRNGIVSLENEELLIEEMPVLDDTFGQ